MPHTLLIADDEKYMHELLKRTFTPDRFKVLSIFDGTEVASVARKESPDLILLDISMPKRSGKEVLQELRNDPKTQLIPVLILTGNRGRTLGEAEGFRLGADDYVEKPFDVKALKARVESILQRNTRFLSVDPLTKLPGSSAINHEIERRIRDGEQFALVYVDIDDLRGYNESHGVDRGDQALRDLADVMRESLRAVSTSASCQDFLGHITEDDFIILTDPDCEEKLAHQIIDDFRQRTPDLTLSIASTSTAIHAFKHHVKLMDIVKNFKNFLKERKDHKESVYIKDPARPRKG